MMRRLALTAVSVALIGGAFVTGSAPPREPAPGPRPEIRFVQKNGYFNMPRVMKEYRRATDSVAKLNSRRLRMTGNLVGLQAMYREIQAKAQVAAKPEVKDRLAQDLIMLTRSIEDMNRDLMKALNDKASDLIAALHDEIQETVAEMAKANGLIAVHGHPVDLGQIHDNAQLKELHLKPPALQPFFLDPTVDYTDELIRRLNRKHEDRAGNE